MAETQWTPQQRNAIDCRGGTLLVSAAAGSGKTAVLVERTIRRITDPDAPADIDRFLVVTFTNAAASEMRAKIASAVTKALAANPSNRHLSRQLTLIHKAKITTVHSFCLSLARNHFQALGLLPDFRVGDATELEMIREQVLTALLDACFDAKTPDFLALADSFQGSRDNGKLEEYILSLHDKLMSAPDPGGRAAGFIAAYDEAKIAGIAASPWGQELIGGFVRALKCHKNRFSDMTDELMQDPVLADKYAPAFFEDTAGIKRLLDMRGASWDELRAALSGIEFAGLKPAKNVSDPALQNRAKAVREEWKKDLRRYRDTIFAESEASVLEDISACTPVVRELLSLAIAFKERYTAEKARRNIVDFADLEHFALALLTDGVNRQTGEVISSALAKELTAEYDEIMVDEYQDTNTLQDCIFNALDAAPGKLFMVGDVKQSIYRFRLAEPSIFLEKYNTYADIQNAGGKPPFKQILSRNFRSRNEVLEAVNTIFEAVCSRDFGELDYTEKEMLRPGASFPEGDGYKTEIDIVDLAGREEPPEKTEGSDVEDAIEELTKLEAEAAEVAKRIRELLDSRLPVNRPGGSRGPVAPGDIVILLRSTSGRAQTYEKALSAQGVPCISESGGAFYESGEIVAMLAFLEAICNPLRDIPLLGMMRSPAFGFTVRELAVIRLGKPQSSFYDAVLHAARCGDTKCRELLDMLEEFRDKAREMPVGELIHAVYIRTGLPALYSAMENGEVRRGNLMTLWAKARAYEGSSMKGLRGFLKYMDRMKGNSESAPPPAAADAVRIMSIHKSKGLEFPIVLLAGNTKRFNTDDLRRPVVFHKTMGVGCRRRDVSRGIEYTTLPREAVNSVLEREMKAEELRVLYVAMTRAREKLILFFSYPDAGRTITSLAAKVGSNRPAPYVLERMSDPSGWLLLPIFALPEGRILTDYAGMPPMDSAKGGELFDIRIIATQEKKVYTAPKSAEKAADAKTDDLPSPEKIRQKACREYAHPAAVLTPSKLTVTQLKGRFKDEEAAGHAGQLTAQRPVRPPAPAFISEQAGLSGAQRGTAVHTALQYIDYAKAATIEGTKGELRRMTAMALITEAQAAAVNPDMIAEFFASPLGCRIRQCPHVRREFKFTLLVRAQEYVDMGGEQGEEILLQGVADCILEEDDGLVLLDFKTDHPAKAGAAAGDWLAERTEGYRPQLAAYGKALERIFGRSVKESWLCFIAAGALVELNK